MLVWQVINIALIFWLLLPCVLVILTCIARLKAKNIAFLNTEKLSVHTTRSIHTTQVTQADFACIITAHKNFDICLPLIQSLLQQQYDKFHIYIVADDCVNLEQFTPNERVHLIVPQTPLASKVRSLKAASQQFIRKHDYVSVFDADNTAAPNFLNIINTYIQQGFVAIQGKRTAHNLDTIYACADATGEIYKNYIERLAPFVLGSSASIAGSGMAVRSDLFNAFLDSPAVVNRIKRGEAVSAEDKLLQYFLLNQNLRIAYASQALIYDEKVREAAQVKRQRTRWLFAYFDNLPAAARLIPKGMTNLSINQLLFGVMAIYPPLFLLLTAAVAGLFLQTIFYCLAITPPCFPTNPSATIKAVLLLATSITIFIVNILFTLWLSKAPRQIWHSLWGIPLFVAQQAAALVKINKAKHDFMPTQHKKM